jgi:glycosyltransferase involved in cell wall biosynthesis
MKSPSLTVVLPNYNHSQFLPKSLRALCDRERPPDELIIVDDGSTDKSWEIIQDFARKYPFIRAIRNEKNMGCEFSVNRGLQLAQGDFFYGAAADDFVQPGFLEKSMALLSRYPEAGLCCTIGDWRELSTGLNWHVGVGMTDQPAFIPPQRMVELERAGRLFIAGHTVIIKKSALFEVGKFNSEIKYACDWFSYTVTGFRYGICVVPEPLAVIQIQPNSYYQRGRRDKQGDLKVMEAIVRLLSEPQYQESAERMRRSGALYLWGYPMLRCLVTHREFHRFLNPTYLRKASWYITKLQLKRVTPAPLGNLYFKLAGYRARTPQSANASA